MAKRVQEDIIDEAVRFGAALGSDVDHAAALDLVQYRNLSGAKAFFAPNAIKVVRRIDLEFRLAHA
jgi:hypothetical protein